MTVELSNLISIASVLFVAATFFIARRKDAEQDTHAEDVELAAIKEALLKANIKLDQVCATTTETRSDIKAMQNTVNDHDRRLALVEHDLKTAFTRIDELRDT